MMVKFRKSTYVEKGNLKKLNRCLSRLDYKPVRSGYFSNIVNTIDPYGTDGLFDKVNELLESYPVSVM